MENSLIQFQNLSVGYKNHPCLASLNAELNSSEVVCLLGANGIGKSTLLKTISGELLPIAGDVKISGKSIKHYTFKQLASMIAIVTTDRIMAGGLTVKELVSLGRHPHTGFLGRLNNNDIEIVHNSISAVGMKHKENSYVSELSDGERQKVMIARALAQQTSIILLDEPFSFLDAASRIEILNLLKQISRRNNVGILLSSHDVSQSLRMADRIWLLTTNKHLVIGTPKSLIANKSIDELFDVKGVRFDSTQNDFISAIDNL